MANETQQKQTATSGAQGEPSSEADGAPKGISAIEWVVAFIGLAILLGLVGFLFVGAVQNRGLPPSLRFEVESISAVTGGYVVEFAVTNDGDTTAADVTVVGQLLDGETVVEEQEMTLDYAPPHSARRGGLFFSNNPAAGELMLSASGYLEP